MKGDIIMHFGVGIKKSELTPEQALVTQELEESLRLTQERSRNNATSHCVPTIRGIHPKRPSGARRSGWVDSEGSDL